ncbi:MAG: YkgJ family cysteine cluster protein [Leptospiraceae bacterium]|nr:YkgJ family cysteine cluster protein [Leptospiraceae bacterium]MDW7976322.1 YkgJ family cysteine cluster protein [Leptospiraceae bacterium]
MKFQKRNGVKSNQIEARAVPEIELYFPKFSRKEEKSLTSQEKCILCHGCCMYITVPLDPPDNEETIENYLWYLYHRNIEVYLDHNDQWQLLVKTPCENLLPNGLCSIYEKRPKICREYDPSSCSRVGKDYKVLFKTASDFLKFINKKNKK